MSRASKIEFPQYLMLLGNLYPLIFCQTNKIANVKINLIAAEKKGGASTRPNLIANHVDPQIIPSITTPR